MVRPRASSSYPPRTRRGRGAGLRALRPGVARRWSTPRAGSSAASRSTRWSTTSASAAPRRSSPRPACARTRTCSRRSRQLQEPLGLAGDQPGHRVHRLARHRRLRGLDRAARGARRADADRRRHRRQFGQPDHHADRARARARPDPGRLLGEAARQGARRRRCSTAWSGARCSARSPTRSTATSRWAA